MAQIFHQKDLSLKNRNSPIPEFFWQTSENLAEISKSKHLKFDVRSLDAGKYSFPYHYRRNAEEIFAILSGQAMLRTPSGFEEVSTGDIVFFETGECGAHQLYCQRDEPCRYLDICTAAEIDVCVYPDSGKINILPFMEVYQSADRTSYYQ